jgi:8-amino-7-oxononanoate synthase
MSWQQWVSAQLGEVRAANRWRELTLFNANLMISFASNDYLGLSKHPVVLQAAIDALHRDGAGATASRLVVGTRAVHAELEHAIAQWQHTDRALVLPSGYQANVAAMTVLGAADATIFSDELNHASIIDGCRLAKARCVVYRHSDMQHLRELLQSAPGRKLVVSDIVFSMDGDVAPLHELAQLCAEHDALLVLDEAHAVLQSPERLSCETLRIGTLSKTLGSQGGWIAGAADVIDLLINRARSFIFTTALAPASAAAALAALKIVISDEGERLRAHLRRLVAVLEPNHSSPVIPFVLGDETSALRAAAHLHDCGFQVPAIRPPSVAAGTSRLRIALSAEHQLEDVHRLRGLLMHIRQEWAA